MPITDDQFQRESDARTLIEAAEIQADSKRFKAAMKGMKKLESENKKRATAITVAKKLKDL